MQKGTKYLALKYVSLVSFNLTNQTVTSYRVLLIFSKSYSYIRNAQVQNWWGGPKLPIFTPYFPNLSVLLHFLTSKNYWNSSYANTVHAYEQFGSEKNVLQPQKNYIGKVRQCIGNLWDPTSEASRDTKFSYLCNQEKERVFGSLTFWWTSFICNISE